MRITNPYSTNLTPYRPNLESSLDQRFAHFQSFRSALQSGNLAASQHAFPAFQKDMQSRLENLPDAATADKKKQALLSLQKLGESLGTGDISAVRQAFVALKLDLHMLYTGGGKGEGASAGTPPATTAEPRGTILNEYA